MGIEPQAIVELDCSAGPVFIYVHGDCFIRGDFTAKSGAPPINLFLACFTSGTLSVERPFKGTLVAPNGSIDLATLHGGIHSGAFFAKNISVQPDNTIQLVPFSGTPFIGV